MSVKQVWRVELDVYSKTRDDSTFLEPENIIATFEDEIKQRQLQTKRFASKKIQILEIYIPIIGQIGWFRVERGASVITCSAPRQILEGIAESVLTQPEEPAFVDPRFLQQSTLSSWPPPDAPKVWLTWDGKRWRDEYEEVDA